MLLPGQGLLAFLLGLTFINFSSKFRVGQCLISSPGPILRLINGFRLKKGTGLILD